MMLVDFKALLKLFREVPFSIRIEETQVSINRMVVACEFFQLTRFPIPSIADKGDSEVYECLFVINIQQLLESESERWRDIYGNWHEGVLSPMMRSMFLESITKGEVHGNVFYKHAEVALEFYLQYITMYPKVETLVFEGEEYHEHKGIDTDEETRLKKLNFFMLEKTKYLYSHFGIDAVHWMNIIRSEMNITTPSTDEDKERIKQLEEISAKADLLLADLGLAEQLLKNQKRQ